MRVTTRQLLAEIEQLHDEDHADKRVGPSDYLKCEKQIELRVKGTPEDEPIEDNHAAIIGTMIHAAFAAHLDARYSKRATAEFAVTVPGLDRTGTADAVWYRDGELVDLKTCSQRAFDRVVTHGAKPEHVGQCNAYALGLNRSDIPIHTCVLAYISRESGDVHEVVFAYDEASGREAVDWLANVEQMIDAGFDMPRRGNGPDTGFPCDWCPFWRTCWDVDNTPDDRSHASKFTQDDEIEQLIDVYVDTGEVERDAKAARAAARQRLVGIHYDLNGRRLSWSRPKQEMVDEIDVEALTVAAVEAGLDVPMVSVPKFTSSRITAKRTNTQKGATE